MITSSVFRLGARRTGVPGRTPERETAPVSEKRVGLNRSPRRAYGRWMPSAALPAQPGSGPDGRLAPRPAPIRPRQPRDRRTLDVWRLRERALGARQRPYGRDVPPLIRRVVQQHICGGLVGGHEVSGTGWQISILR